MDHLKSSLSRLGAVALVLGIGACGSSQPQTNMAASQAPRKAPYEVDEPYAGTADAAITTGEPATGVTSPQYPQTITPPSTGGVDTYGSQGTVGSGTAPGSTAGTYGTDQTGSTYGAPSGSSQYRNPGSPGTTDSTSAMGGSTDVSNLNDAQLAAVLTAINQGEIQQAQLAQSKAKSPEVKRFAQHMLTAHRDIQNKDSALFSRLQITPSDNAVSNQLQTDAQNQLSTLQGETGRDFDRDYIEVQIKDHNSALELIDRMISNTKSSELKGQLQNVRPKVQQHLRDAERIQQSMQQGSTNKQQGSGMQHNGGSSEPSSPSNPSGSSHGNDNH